MEVAAVLAIVVVIVGFGIWLGIRQKEKLRQAFAEFAPRFNCQAVLPQGFLAGHPSMSGTYRKHPLRVWMFTRSSGSGKNRSSTTYTAFVVQVQMTQPFEFHIYEEGFFSRIGIGVFGMQDIQINDAEFDPKFVVKGSDEARIVQLLTPPIKQRFLEMADRYMAFGVKFEGNQLYFERAAAITSEKFRSELEAMIEFYCDLADQLERGR